MQPTCTAPCIANPNSTNPYHALTDRKIQINDRKTEKVISLSVYLQNKNDKDGKIVCQSFNFPVGAPFPYRVFINRKFLDVKSEILSLSNEDNRKIYFHSQGNEFPYQGSHQNWMTRKLDYTQFLKFNFIHSNRSSYHIKHHKV